MELLRISRGGDYGLIDLLKGQTGRATRKKHQVDGIPDQLLGGSSPVRVLGIAGLTPIRHFDDRSQQLREILGCADVRGRQRRGEVEIIEAVVVARPEENQIVLTTAVTRISTPYLRIVWFAACHYSSETVTQKGLRDCGAAAARLPRAVEPVMSVPSQQARRVRASSPKRRSGRSSWSELA